jgi:hypothetical protein
MENAKQSLQLESSRAAGFAHHSIRGDERAASLMKFIGDRLPLALGVAKGEVIDYRDARTGQLDFVIYDRARCAPILAGSENLLLPCEALYCVVEVKTKLTQTELDSSFSAALRVRRLRPFKQPFIAARKDGVHADDARDRCLYLVFGFSSDLADDDEWAAKEYKRVERAAHRAGAEMDCVDWVVSLDRGIIKPDAGSGKRDSSNSDTIFLETFLHIVNFLGRESDRRKPVDWQMYGPRSSPGWQKLT